MWKVHIIYSEKIDLFYTGVTDDLVWRLERHNQGWGRDTKRGIPWFIVHTEDYDNKSEALKREREIKSKKRRSYIESLVNI